MCFLVDDVVLVLAQTGDDLVDLPILVARRLALTADDERRARLVDEDRVHLVDDRVVQVALDVFQRGELHVVAQIVETKFVILSVCDVGSVGALLFLLALRVDDHADAHPEEVVELSHPLRVAPCQVVVHRDDVDALAFERIEIARERRHQRLPLAGAHFGD